MDNRSHYYHEGPTTQYAFAPVRNGAYSNASNMSDEESAYMLYNILIPSFGAIIIASNLAVVISCCFVLKKGQEPRSTYLLLGNLAVADLLTGIAVVFMQSFPNNLRTHQICASEIGLVSSSILISIYLIGLIAVDRFLYIFYGLNFQRWVHPTKLQVVAVIIWILGCIIGYLPLIGWARDTNNGKNCWLIVLVPKNLIVISVIIATLPIILIIFLYSIVLYRALKTIAQKKATVNGKLPYQDFPMRNLKGFRNKTTQPDFKPKGFIARTLTKKFSTSISSSKRWRAVKVVFFSTISFILAWCPYMIISLYYVNTCENHETKRCKSLSLVLSSPLAILGFTNSLLNPIIYLWWHKGFNNIKRRFSTFRLRTFSQDKRIVPNTGSNATMTTMLQGSHEVIANV